MKRKFACFIFLFVFLSVIYSETEICLVQPLWGKHGKIGEKKSFLILDSEGIIISKRDENGASVNMNHDNMTYTTHPLNASSVIKPIIQYDFVINNNGFSLWLNEKEKYCFENGVLYRIDDNSSEIEKYYTYKKNESFYEISMFEFMQDFEGDKYFDEYYNVYQYYTETIQSLKNNDININKLNANILVSCSMETILPLLFLDNNKIETHIKKYTATSELKEKNTVYCAKNLKTKNGLPWASANGYGIGDKINIEIPRSYTVKLGFYNGFQSDTRPDLYKANSRAKKVEIRCLETNEKIQVELNDSKEKQIVDLKKLDMKYNTDVNLEITILEVYPGEKYKDLCIQAIIPEY